MTRRGTDETLAQLNSYLHRTAVAAAPPQTGAFDDPASPRVGTGLRLFVSHHHESAAQAAALREELGKRSIDAFVARDSIDPTEEWEEVILAALPSCDACLALLTESFSGSKWCDQEIGFWMARDRLVIPVEAGVNPYGFLGRYQALPVKKELTAVELSVAVSGLLARKEQSREQMARALVQRWAATDSYAAARENFGFLKTIPIEAWTQQLVDEVWEAHDRNSQIREPNIDWRPSEEQLFALFADPPYRRAAHKDDV